MKRSWLWIMIAAPSVLIIGFFWLMMTEPGQQQSRTAPVRVSGEASIGGDFTLVDHTGRDVTQADFLGKPMLIYFGYTYCPDVCPFSLQIMAAALDRLPADMRSEFQPILITVDPRRDTVEHMAQYVTSPAFPDGLIGLTGSETQIRAVTSAYRVVFQQADAEGGGDGSGLDYLMDHSSFIYLMNAEGRFEDVFAHGANPETVATRLQEFIENTPHN